jgi:ABC-type glycerol-3-phosphate transport system substrate-binding protein
MVDDHVYGSLNDDVGGFRRRSVLKTAAGTGLVTGVSGCLGGGGESDSTSNAEPIPDEVPEEDVTVKIAADSNFKESQQAVQESLRKRGGLPESVSIEFQAGSFTTGDRQTKYQQLLNANQETPTLLMLDNGWTIPFIARNQIQNLSQSLPSSMTDRVTSDYVQTMVQTATGPEGDLYGIPLFADFPTIQYRKDLLRQAGYSDSDFSTWATDPLTWSKFSSIIKDAMDETGKRGFLWQGKAYIGLACCDFVEFMGSWGGSYFGAFENLFGPVGDRPITVTEESVINSLRMMRTFVHGSSDSESLSDYEQISPADVASYTEEPSRKPFTNGNAIALRNWPYSIVINGKEKNHGSDLGVMPMPYSVPASESKYGPEIGGSTAALGGWHLCMNPNASKTKKKAALQVLKALQTDDVRVDLFEIGGWIPPIPDLISTDRTKQLEPVGRYVDALQVASKNAVPRPVTPVWSAQETQVAKEVNATLRQQKSPSKAMSDLEGALKAIEQQG